MVEFKRSRRDGELYPIEVNHKFWGSLDLSICAGVDSLVALHCPRLLYKPEGEGPPIASGGLP